MRVLTWVCFALLAAGCSGILGIDDGTLNANADAGVDAPEPDAAAQNNLIFATSMKFSGNLGGITGADAKCASAAACE